MKCLFVDSFTAADFYDQKIKGTSQLIRILYKKHLFKNPNLFKVFPKLW